MCRTKTVECAPCLFVPDDIVRPRADLYRFSGEGPVIEVDMPCLALQIVEFEPTPTCVRERVNRYMTVNRVR